MPRRWRRPRPTPIPTAANATPSPAALRGRKHQPHRPTLAGTAEQITGGRSGGKLVKRRWALPQYVGKKIRLYRRGYCKRRQRHRQGMSVLCATLPLRRICGHVGESHLTQRNRDRTDARSALSHFSFQQLKICYAVIKKRRSVGFDFKLIRIS